MLLKIFGAKMEEVTGDWGELHNEDLHDLCLVKILLGCKNQRW